MRLSKRMSALFPFAFPLLAGWHHPALAPFSLDPLYAPDTGAPAGGGAAPAAPAAGVDGPETGQGGTGAAGADDDAADDDDDVRAAGGAAGAGAAPPPNPLQRKLNDAIRRRKKGNAIIHALCERLGIDPDELEARPTNDPDNPYQIVGLDDATPPTTGQRGGRAEPARPGKPSAKLVRLERENAALRDFVTGTIVADRIRSACVKHNAIDDDNGQFSDIVAQVLPKMRTDFVQDDDTGRITVTTYAADASGEMLYDGRGEPHSEETLVVQLLNAKPKYRHSTYRPGTGAGGSALPGANPRRSGTPGAPVTAASGNGHGRGGATDATDTAINQFFGR
jgi:hypothetical protein